MLLRLAGITALFLGAARANSSEVAEVFQSAMKLVHAVHSYEFSAVERSVETNGETTITHVKFYQSGSMYRTESGNANLDSNEPPGRIFAFNGERYQNYEHTISTLSFSGKNRFPNPYGEENPLLLPYVWMLADPGSTWTDLRLTDTWLSRADDASLLAGEKLRSFECDVVLLPYRLVGQGAVLKVYLAKDLGHYPIRVEGSMSSTDSQFTLDVIEHLAVPTESSPVIVPIVIRLEERTGKQRNLLEWKVDLESVKINHEIPVELFTISPGIAKIVDDYDRNMESMIRDGKIQPPQAMKELPKSNNTPLTWLFVVNIAVIVLLAALAAHRRRKSSQGKDPQDADLNP